MWQLLTVVMTDWVIPNEKTNSPLHWLGRMLFVSACGWLQESTEIANPRPRGIRCAGKSITIQNQTAIPVPVHSIS